MKKEFFYQHKEKIVFLLLSLLYFVRLLFLNADPKYMYLAQHSVTDEIAYHENAIKIANYGIRTLFNGSMASTALANTKTLLLSNLGAGFFMSIFGNGFFGLRFTYVLTGYLIGLLIWACMKLLIPNHKLVHVFVLLAYICDFHFFMQTRSGMTVVICTFATTLLLYTTLKETGAKRWFLLGLISVASFCIVYMGLPFLIPWAFFVWAMEMIFDRKRRKGGLFYPIGVVAGCLLSEATSLLFYRQHFWDTILDTLFAHNGKINTQQFQIAQLLHSFKSYFAAYQFIYNYLLLVLGILSIFLMLYAIFAKKDETAFIICSLICVHWVQTICLDQLTDSKASITYAALLVGIAYSFVTYYDELTKKGWLHRIFVFIGCVVTMGSALLIYSTYRIGRCLSNDLRHVLYIFIIISAAALLAVLLTNKKKLFYVAFVLSLAFGVIASSYYGFCNLSYAESEMLKDIGERTNNGKVINGVSFMLYNSCVAPVSIYDHYRGRGYDFDYVRNQIKQDVYDYDELYCVFSVIIGDEWNVPTINANLLADTPYEFEELQTYHLEYTEDPTEGAIGQYNTALYKKVKRAEK